MGTRDTEPGRVDRKRRMDETVRRTGVVGGADILEMMMLEGSMPTTWDVVED